MARDAIHREAIPGGILPEMFDFHLILGILAGILAAIAVVPYIKDILHGSTRPNAVSWVLWVAILSISILAQISAGASWSLIFLIGDLVGTSIILILSFTGYGYRKYGMIEWVCLALAVVAVVSWQLTDRPVLALLFAILADIMASVPTVVKAWRDPWSEHATMWMVIGAASVLGMFSTTKVDVANLIFPGYILLINGLVGVLSFVGRRLKRYNKNVA